MKPIFLSQQILGFALAVVLPALRSPAQDNWVLTRADFSAERVELLSMDGAAASVRSSGQAHSVPLDDLLSLERVNRPANPGGAGRFVAILTSGGRAAGYPKALQGENVIWINPTLGSMTLPLRSLQCLVRADAPPPPQVARTDDAITLSNDDSVRGIITDLTDAAITIQQPSGDATTVPLDSVQLIAFATTVIESEPRANSYRIGLADGSVIAVSTVRLDPQKVDVELADGSRRSVPLQAVVAIEHVNGPVVWLSSLRPIESVQKPFLDLAWPARMNRSVNGEPLRFGSRSYDHGIGVHSYSRLVFAIDPAMHAFRTQYAIAGDLPYANVAVRIKVDDRVVHENAVVRSGSLSPPVLVDVTGGKTLTLEVDYGQGYDVQDRLNWIEPAFLKKFPTTQPN